MEQHEANKLLGPGRSWSVPGPALEKLMEVITAGERPAGPDSTLLRQRPDDALQAAHALVLADGQVRPEETEPLKRVRAVLTEGCRLTVSAGAAPSARARRPKASSAPRQCSRSRASPRCLRRR